MCIRDRANPHALIEGAAISQYAMGSDHAFIYLRGEVCLLYTSRCV